MRVILACEPNGFGPVSKLTAIARLLPEAERIFVGDAGAYAFARRNSDCFEHYLTIDEFRRNPDLAAGCDFAMVVMEPDVTFDLVQLGVPVYLFDSLLEFWLLPNGLAPLAAAAGAILGGPPDSARATFAGFAIHERKVLAHMIATCSFAQNFPGVPERIQALRQLGYGNVGLLGSIIDLPPSAPPPRTPRDDGSWSMLINLGGVQNFAIRFHDNDYTIDLFELWAERFLRDTPDCRSVIICCGRYREADTKRVAGGTLVRRFAPRSEFMELLESADVVLSTPGRTTLHEAVHLRKVPILLPEQHHNQYCNIMALGQTALGRLLSVPLGDVIPLGDLPDDDMAGTLHIIECTRQVLTGEALFQRLDDMLRARIRAFRALGPGEHEALIEDLAGYLRGADFAATVRSLAGPSDRRSRRRMGAALDDA